MKKILKIILPIFIFFIGFSVNAKGTMFIANGEVLNQCTGNNCAYPYAGTTNIRFILDPMSFNADSQYTFKLNFSAGTSMASPTLTDCGLNINGAYVSPQSRNSGRVNYECSSDYSNCTSTYASTIVWTATNTFSNVPVFIQCDMTPSATRYNQTNFAISVTDSNGSVINAINDNIDRMIEVNNYNANENNKNRDSNSEMIGGKIDNNTNVIGGKLDSHANTISGKLQQIIDTLSNLGSNIISAIGNGVNSIVNKIGDLIGMQEVCNVYFKVTGDKILVNTTESTEIYTDTYLDTSGNTRPHTVYNTTGFIYIPANSGQIFIQHIGTDYSSNVCLYNSNKDLLGCNTYSGSDNNPIYITQTSGYPIYVRFSYGKSSITYTISGDCQKSGILGLFNKFTTFISKFFDSNTDNANSLGSSEFQNFTTTNVGLRGLLDTLVSFVNNIFNSTCSPLVLPIPFVDNTVTLPCMSGIYTTYFPTFFHIYQLITTGLIAYRVIINLFHKVHQLEDVNYDKVEVLSL